MKKINKLLSLSLVIFLMFAFTQTTPLKTFRVAEGVKISLPKDFQPMKDADIAKKYFTDRKPIAMYTDPEGKADFGFNLTETEWTKDDLAVLQRFYEATIRRTFDEVQFMQKEKKHINGREYILFEFIGFINSDPNAIIQRGKKARYNYMIYTVWQKRVALFQFNCPGGLYRKWQPIAHEIMNTPELRETKEEKEAKEAQAENK
ncbi:MAG: hypothetical protein JJT94_14485 [Bernardetiaceae bacterium]|nr:hypothetical protein [Bernardetiaceae bacterium]